MASFHRIAGRSVQLEGISPLALNLLFALLSLLLFSLLLVSVLLLLRRYRRTQTPDPPLPVHKAHITPPMRPMHRRTHSTYSIPLVPSRPLAPPVCAYREKLDVSSTTSTPLSSPLPEIHITFPDEVDETGKRHSGRVMVVYVGDNSEGLGPLDEEDIHHHIRTLVEPFPTLHANA